MVDTRDIEWNAKVEQRFCCCNRKIAGLEVFNGFLIQLLWEPVIGIDPLFSLHLSAH